MQDGSGIVALGFALHGIPRQMLAAQIDTEQCLPVTDRLVRLEVELPAGTAVQLGQHPALAGLSGGGSKLLDDPVAPVVFGQAINAGIAHMLVKTHQGAFRHGLIHERILVQDVPGKDDAVLLAPVIERLGEVLQEQIIRQVDVMQLDRRDQLAAHPVEQLRNDGTGVIAVTPAELPEQIVRPAHGADHDPILLPPVIHAAPAVRLIGEDALDGGAQPVAALFAVLLMGQLNESVGRLAAHGINVGRTVIV